MYKEPQPLIPTEKKQGYCAVKERPDVASSYPQNCLCQTTHFKFYDIQYHDEFPNFCKMWCNGDSECLAYSYSKPNVCRYYTTASTCRLGGTGQLFQYEPNVKYTCTMESKGITGTIFNFDGMPGSGNFEKGCYIKDVHVMNPPSTFRPPNSRSGDLDTIRPPLKWNY